MDASLSRCISNRQNTGIAEVPPPALVCFRYFRFDRIESSDEQEVRVKIYS